MRLENDVQEQARLAGDKLEWISSEATRWLAQRDHFAERCKKLTALALEYLEYVNEAEFDDGAEQEELVKRIRSAIWPVCPTCHKPQATSPALPNVLYCAGHITA